ncbi:hypothetical protein [Cellulomonas endometrii]|uniref:hypothetical protein n=1 Tax=Cellulomonas endometrii TaxID=3036301 RepID=UPI0024ACA610|nr:hypothetical protein [Cellulomonas endometrii]
MVSTSDQSGSRILVRGTSSLATELRHLPVPARRALGVSPEMLVVLDAVVAVARLLTDDDDSRSWFEKLDSLGDEIGEAFEHLDTVTVDIQRLVDDMQKIAKRFSGNSPQLLGFVERLVGSGAYRRLKAALGEDGAVLAIGARRAVRAVMPFALALDDAVAFLSPGQVAAIVGDSGLGQSTLRLAVTLDSAIDQLTHIGVPLASATTRAEETQALVADIAAGLDDVVEKLHQVLDGRSTEVLEEFSRHLQRKIRGARDAVALSADGASQAANSLIEFIDRLLRDAFTSEEVLDWLQRNELLDDTTTYEKNGVVYASKRGHALCFARGGRDFQDKELLSQLAASGLVAVRTQMQRIKHSDEGTPEELAAVQEALRAVEGFMVFSVRVGWVSLDRDQLDALRKRLGDVPRDAVEVQRTA